MAAGQRLGVGGPRGSFILLTAFDWHLPIGDETALPAVILTEVDGPADELD